MHAPYLQLFDHTIAPDDDERRRIGLTTALLFVRRQQWLHRRVELVTFEDQDVIRRSNSIDFTLPRWTAEYLNISDSEPSKIVVPVALFRKGMLVHFNLSDEGNDAVPLLSGTQVGPLAELALLATAELILGLDNVDESIAADIQQLTWDRRAAETESPSDRRRPSTAFERLFSPNEPARESRALLKSHPIFLPLAEAFDDNYIAAVLLTIGGGDRRVIHFAYDEEIGERDSLVDRLATTKDMFAGRILRRVAVLATGAGDAESFHMEAEAPEGLRISSRVTLTETKDENHRKDIEERVEKTGSYRRSHIHCNDVEPTDQLAIVLRLGPRSSTIVRGAALTSALTLIAVLYVRLRLGDIALEGTSGAAAVLLVIPTLLSVWVVRSNEHPATTHLLWPLRIVATAPAIFGLAAAGVIVTGSHASWSGAALSTLVGLLGVATWILSATWIGAIRRHGRRRLLPGQKPNVAPPSGRSDSLSRASKGSAQP
jgi:hypothetical protein